MQTSKLSSISAWRLQQTFPSVLWTFEESTECMALKNLLQRKMTGNMLELRDRQISELPVLVCSSYFEQPQQSSEDITKHGNQRKVMYSYPRRLGAGWKQGRLESYYSSFVMFWPCFMGVEHCYGLCQDGPPWTDPAAALWFYGCIGSDLSKLILTQLGGCVPHWNVQCRLQL